jgi:SAM-dependent methyltransferase
MGKRVVDLCCGIGGFSLGFRMEGFEVVAGIDIDDRALRVFQRNFPGARAIKADLLELDGEDVPDADVYIGGIPCQPFSSASRNPSWDARLLGKFFEIVVSKRKMFAMENVPPLMYALGHGTILDSHDFGVPQRRRRLFLTNFPILPHRKRNLPIGHFFPHVKEFKYKKTRNFELTRRRSGPLDPAFTICRRNMGDLVFVLDDGRVKEVTVDDLKVLFGFPADYKIEEGEKDLMGECVCPPVARHVARSCLYYMPTFHKIMGGRRWKRLNLRSEDGLCAQLSLIP